MDNVKDVVGIVATILTFIGYIPYVRDIVKGKTKPHILSWFLWGFISFILFALQMYGHAGTGAFVTFAAATMCCVVIVLGFKYRSTSEIKKLDVFFILIAFLALGIWIIAKQPVLSAILATLIDLLGFAPTVRKSWNKPYSETLSFYYLNTLRFSLAVFSLRLYSIVTALYPVTWLLANALFAILIIIRRKNHLHEAREC